MNRHRTIGWYFELLYRWLKEAVLGVRQGIRLITNTLVDLHQEKEVEVEQVWVDDGTQPIVTQQPTVGGNAGQPLEIVMCEVVTNETDEVGLFQGLWSFLRNEKPRDYTAVDGILMILLLDLKAKAVHLGADAVVSTTIKSVRGVDDSGQRRIKMSAIGTAIRLKGKIS